MDTLFYDGQCPLCRREMRLLERLKRSTLQLQDIHSLTVPASERRHPAVADLLHNLHLKTDKGVWIVGLAANVRAWSHTGYGWLFRPLLWPGVRPLAEAAYQRWADRRFARRYGCAECGVAETDKKLEKKK